MLKDNHPMVQRSSKICLCDKFTQQLIHILLTKSRFSSIVEKGSYLHAKFAGIVDTAFVLNDPPADGTEWVELFVREMMNATSTDDARARAAIMLESLEKSISASASAEATQNFQKVGICTFKYIVVYRYTRQQIPC